MTKPAATLLEDRVILRLDGQDVESFLQGIVSQDVSSLNAGEASFGCLLTPQGKILFDFFIIRSPKGGFLIDCHAPAADALKKRLSLYKLRADVTITTQEDWTVGVIFDDALKDTPEIHLSFIDPRLSKLGQRVIDESHIVEAFLNINGARTDHQSYNTHSIALGVPAFGTEFDSDEIFPMDVNYDMLNGVDYKKGCFVGQEVSSRMKRKGVPRKRTVLVTFEKAPLTSGNEITAGASTIGTVISTTEKKGLALIRLDRWEKAIAAGDVLKIGAHHAQLTLPDYLK